MNNNEGVKHEIIIVRRGGHGEHDDHHGGVWKVAFADFMTAMMAFFLVLWIVNSTSKETRSSVARYFNPLQISNTTPARKGLRDQNESSFDADATNAKPKDPARGKDKSPTKTDKGSIKEPKAEKTEKKGKIEEPSADTIPSNDPAKSKKKEAEKTIKNDETSFKNTGHITKIAPSLNDREITDNNQIDKKSDYPSISEKARQKLGAEISKYRDPFAPLRPTIAHNPENKSLRNSESQQSGRFASNDQKQKPQINTPVEVAAKITPNQSKVQPEKNKVEKVLHADKSRNTLRDLEALATKLRDEKGSPAISVTLVKEGVLVSLMEKDHVPMFRVNTARLLPSAIKTIERVAGILTQSKATIIIQGHTDARPYESKAYNNWNLSAARAQSAMAHLIRRGISEKRIERIEAHADRILRNPHDRFAAENRRVNILIRGAF